MKNKSIKYLLFSIAITSSLLFTACGNKTEPVSDAPETTAVEETIETEVSDETTTEEVIIKENSTTEATEDVATGESITFEYKDPWEDGFQYKYVINTNTREINYNIFLDVQSEDIEDLSMVGNIVVEDDTIWNTIIKILNTDILVEETGTETGYKYPSYVSDFIHTLSDLVTYDLNTISFAKEDVLQEIWDEVYAAADDDGDELITCYEETLYSFEIILENMVNQ